VLHGDCWPGNLLWRDGRLAGVIDWEEAAFGDPMADLANIRLEIARQFGTAAMGMLTAEYRTRRHAAGTATLPAWNLCAAVRACEFPLETLPPPAETIASMRAAVTLSRARTRLPKSDVGAPRFGHIALEQPDRITGQHVDQRLCSRGGRI